MKIRLLCSQADRETLRPILDALGKKGVQAVEKDAAVTLCALSERFYADKACVEALLSLLGKGAENVLPLQLDSAPVPDELMNSLYVRNIISAPGRDAELLSERVFDALPKKKSRLPLILTLGGVGLAAVLGLLIWNGSKQPAEEPLPVMEVESEPSVYIPAGWTAEELARIVDAVIVGDEMAFYTAGDVDGGRFPTWDEFAYRDWYDDAPHYFSRSDGHEYQMKRYEDLRFIELMPNLRYLSLVLVEADTLPDLTALTKLDGLNLMDCGISSLDWVGGSSLRQFMSYNTYGALTDYGPLSACPDLYDAQIDLYGAHRAELGDFCPPKLSRLRLTNGQNVERIDLSALSGCAALTELALENLEGPDDLSFLENARRLESLQLSGLHALRDISALGGKKALKRLQIDDCGSVTDYTPIAGCAALEELHLDTNWGAPLRSAAFLSDLPKLRSLQFYGVELNDLDFLEGMGQSGRKIELSLYGNVYDYEGLAAVGGYSFLALDHGSVPLEDILPYLRDCEVQRLELNGFDTVDLSALPRVKGMLSLHDCGLTDLSTLPEDWAAGSLELRYCDRLQSLNGLQKQSAVKNLTVERCPRLGDWNAIGGMWFSELRIIGGYTLPSMEGVRSVLLHVESVEGVEDLSFLEGLDEKDATSFELIGLDGLTNINELRRFHGVYLSVSPQLQEQAADLVRAGNFREYKVEFPAGGWEEDEGSLALLDMEELNTLPAALLRRVEALAIAGDRLFDPNELDVWQDWGQRGAHGYPTLYLIDWDSEEKTPLGTGFVTSLDAFSALTGLRALQLYAQPLTTLDGVQSFTELDRVWLRFCPELRDVSPLFACGQIRVLGLNCLDIESIQGVQNLYALEELSIGGTAVRDISPLRELDYGAAMERGGFDLEMNGCDVEDYAPLAAVPAFTRLSLNDTDAARWLPFVENTPIYRLSADNAFHSAAGDGDCNALLAALAAGHGELTELNLCYNDLTDLTPLLSLPSLQVVYVSQDMEAAIRSLDGAEYAFRLEIQD